MRTNHVSVLPFLLKDCKQHWESWQKTDQGWGWGRGWDGIGDGDMDGMDLSQRGEGTDDWGCDVHLLMFGIRGEMH